MRRAKTIDANREGKFAREERLKANFMVTNTSRETDSMLAVSNSVLACRSFEALEQSVLAPLAEYLDAETSCFLQVVPEAVNATRIGRSTCHNVARSAHSQYVARHFRADPAVDRYWLGQNEPMGVYCTSEVWDYGEFVKTEFYNEFFRPNSIHHVMVMMVRTYWEPASWLALGFHRPSRASPFVETQKRRARSVVGAAGGALRGLLMQEALDVRDQVIDHLESGNPDTGIIFFDTNLVFVYANTRGLADLEIGKYFDSQDGVSNVRLEKVMLVCRTLMVTQDFLGSSKIELCADEEIVATVQARMKPGGDLLFVVHTSGRKTETQLMRRCENFGMTAREVDIIKLIGAGMSNAEIASCLFISPRTVENHLRSIYAKAAVNRRTQLIHRLAESV